MPTRFLSDAEIERLEGWPDAIDQPDLARYFDLDGDDLGFVRRQHSPAAQLGVALQLCALRWLGFVPDDLTGAPPDAVAALAGVLDVPPRVIFEYAVRPQTRREHRPMVREHAGFRAGALAELDALAGWLTDQDRCARKVDGFGHELLLATGEVVVDRSARGAGALDDLAEARPAEPALAEQGDRTEHQAVASVGPGALHHDDWHSTFSPDGVRQVSGRRCVSLSGSSSAASSGATRPTPK